METFCQVVLSSEWMWISSVIWKCSQWKCKRAENISINTRDWGYFSYLCLFLLLLWVKHLGLSLFLKMSVKAYSWLHKGYMFNRLPVKHWQTEDSSTKSAASDSNGKKSWWMDWLLGIPLWTRSRLKIAHKHSLQ